MNSKDILFASEVRGPMPPIVYPWKTIEMDADFSGQWLVAGDLDDDGELEFVSARNDKQSVTAISAYMLDGTCLWKWGQAGAGSSRLGYDVPVQIYDIDGDGKNEVIFSEEGFLVVLDGLNGKEIERYPLPSELSVADCITFANLRGEENASDVIVKTRYTKLWAYTADWRELWNWTPGDGYKTCHHPTPVDLDGDGKDEIMAGYTMLDHDGTEMWTFSSREVSLSKGHLDCCRIAESGDTPEEFRFAVTCCGAGLVAYLDGVGNTLWEISGHHFESLRVAPISANLEGKQVFVDIDHRPYGESPAWLIDINGKHIGTYTTNYSRQHASVDWNGDGLDEIVLSNALTICDGSGNRVVSFGPGTISDDIRTDQKAGGPSVTVCDVTGRGIEDVVLHADRTILVYRGPSQTKAKDVVSDTINFTLY